MAKSLHPPVLSDESHRDATKSRYGSEMKRNTFALRLLPQERELLEAYARYYTERFGAQVTAAGVVRRMMRQLSVPDELTPAAADVRVARAALDAALW